MASLNKHGESVIIKQLWQRWAFCSDGTILVNKGHGWKVHGKLKKKSDYKKAAEARKEWLNADRIHRPMLQELERLLDKMVPSLAKRLYLREALRSFAHDPEAVKNLSEEDGQYGANLSMEDSIQLCRIYLLVREEAQNMGSGHRAALDNNSAAGE